jgi:hypothetical protein
MGQEQVLFVMQRNSLPVLLVCEQQVFVFPVVVLERLPAVLAVGRTTYRSPGRPAAAASAFDHLPLCMSLNIVGRLRLLRWADWSD